MNDKTTAALVDLLNRIHALAIQPKRPTQRDGAIANLASIALIELAKLKGGDR